MSKRTRTDAEVLISQQREIGLKHGLEYFVNMAWPYVEPSTEFLNNWHVGAICEDLDAVRKGQIRNLVINVPPGCMKSLLVEVFWPVHLWITDPGHKVISASFDSTLTLRDAKRSLALMKSQWFQERWGDLFKVPDDPAAGDYENSAGGWRFSTSIGGKLTGRHCDKFVIDDPHKPQGISKVSLEEVARWWRESRPTRFATPAEGSSVLIMQRLHFSDASSIAEEEGFELRCYPMRRGPKAQVSANDPREEEGELLWPERFPEEVVSKLETVMGSRIAAAQLQQRPVPEGGLIFQQPWFKYWVASVGGPENPHVKTVPTRFDMMCMSWDCTFKDAATSDYVVGQVWARRGADFFLLDQVRARMSFGATCDAIRAMARKWPGVITKLVEDKANGSAVISTLKKEIPGMIAVNPGRTSKADRANAVAPLYESGNVYHPNPTTYPWVTALEDEFTSFPMGANDDCVDAAGQALLWLYNNKSNLPAAMEALAKMGGGRGFFE